MLTYTSIPDCWSEGNDTDIVTGPNGDNGAWAADGFLNDGTTGAARINLYNLGDSDWLVSPTFDLSAGGYEMLVDVGVTTYSGTSAINMGSDDEVQVLISDDAGATWVNLETFNTGNTPSNEGETKQYDLSAHTSATTVIAFWGTEGAVDDPEDYNFFVDNFIVRTPPTCFEPTDLAIADVTDTTATLSWVSGGSGESLYDVEIVDVTAGNTVTGTATNSDVTNPFSLTELVETNDYQYYVRSNCGGGDYSIWTGPFDFTTTASCIVPSDLMITNVDSAAGTADFSWTDNNITPPTEGWEYEIVDITAGGTPTGTGVAAATNPISLTSLVADNQYEILVRAVCAVGETSEWSTTYAWTQIDVPGCVSNPNPADTAVDVQIGANTFTWDIPTDGGAVVSYEVYAGDADDNLSLITTVTDPTVNVKFL